MRQNGHKRLPILQAAWLLALAGLFVISNPGVLQRISIVVEEGKTAALLGLLGVWLMSLFAVLCVVTSSSLAVRAFWGILLGASTASGLIFLRTSGGELSVFDILSIWYARYGAGDAIAFHQFDFALGIAVAVLLALAAILSPFRGRLLPQWKVLWCFPVVPILAIVAIIHAREGQGSRGLPQQFAPLGMIALVAPILVSDQKQERQAVAWEPGPGLARKIVLLVDESVRSDHIDLQSSSRTSPELAALRDKVVNFGPAASGSNCSAYSNAILRFGAKQDDLTHSVRTNAPIWKFAKAAGYKTAFIDAQAVLVKKYGSKFNNFMTAWEAQDIDYYVELDGTQPAHDLDHQLIEKVLELMRLPEPVFIYANKVGAHFPYEDRYPPSAREFQPTLQDERSPQARTNSYRNAIRWSVDRVVARLLRDTPSDDAVVIYTSDHGQNLSEGRLTHCSVEGPDPSEAVVPLLVSTNRPALKTSFDASTNGTAGHFSHFDIAPTLMKLMGYRAEDVLSYYGSSLLSPMVRKPIQFSSGDIFGLFSATVRWTDIDLPERSRQPDNARPQPATEARASETDP